MIVAAFIAATAATVGFPAALFDSMPQLPTPPPIVEVQAEPAPPPPPPPPPAPLAVTADELKAIVPAAPIDRLDSIVAPLNEAMAANGIDNPVRQSAFISQLAVESDQFRTFEEYASGSDYEGRSDLGNVQPGDGERFKGRGAIQVTGRANYEQLSAATGIDFVANPELVADPTHAIESAVWYWNSRNLNAVADQAGIVRVSEVVNGGHNALQQRVDNFTRGLGILGQP